MIEETKRFTIGESPIGGREPFFLIAGPCVIEGEKMALEIAEYVLNIASELGIPYCFKASFDKANRSSIKSFRGPGIDEGLKILKKVKDTFKIPVLTDVHCISQVKSVAEIADIVQIPAFLSRQTDLVVAAAETGRVINVKKGQFLAPQEMKNVIAKIESVGNGKIMLTERGYSFGYNNLVVDMRSLVILRSMGYPVVYDATHSVMLPGGAGDRSGGNREFIPPLTRAAIAVGCDALFIEVHPDPDNALSDKETMLPLSQLKALLRVLSEIDRYIKSD